MINNLVHKMVASIKHLLTYQPPHNPPPFVLDETDKDDKDRFQERPIGPLTDSVQGMDNLLQYAKSVKKVMERAQTVLETQDANDLTALRTDIKNLEKQHDEVKPILLAYTNSTPVNKRLVSASLAENEEIIKELYYLPQNKDIALRRFTIRGRQPVEALLVFTEGLIDKDILNSFILEPLMVFNEPPLSAEEIMTDLESRCLPANSAKPAQRFVEIADGLSGGDSVLFMEGVNRALVIDTRGAKQRGVERAQIEQSVRGSQASFSEGLRINTGLIRQYLPTSELVTEIMDIGDRAPLKCAVMYLKELANPKLVAEVKRRITGIRTDYVGDVGGLDQFIEDHPTIIFPQSFSTEKPERVAAHLMEGRVAYLVDGTPFVHMVPVTFFSFFQSVEDFSLKPPAGTFMRMLRLIGTLISVILPSTFLAIVYFHQEALPTDMILAIAGAREKVPLPTIAEILLMEFSFELIREAGLRVPGLLGSTIGIVGAIILGQAAVAANIVSPIMVVVIAVTGLASFSIPDYRMAFALRLTRFGFLFLALLFGLVGVGFGLIYTAVRLAGMKSFGVPYLAPIGPKAIAGLDVIARGPIFRQEVRPDELNPLDGVRQPSISRTWTEENPVGREDKA